MVTIASLLLKLASILSAFTTSFGQNTSKTFGDRLKFALVV